MDYEKEYKDCLLYIDSYWSKIIHKPAKKRINHNFITIPHHFVSPNDKKFNYIFYWDTYFIFRGLMGTKREWVLKEMVENFTYLFKTYGIVPNFNSHASVGRSQPPFLSSMILDTYQSFGAADSKFSLFKLARSIVKPQTAFGYVEWLADSMKIAEAEYENVWANSSLYNHLVEKYELSRYGDRDIGYAQSSELESGWDFTSRFYNRCNDFLPVDLNTYLYKYEKDFSLASYLLGNKQRSIFWEQKAEKRRKKVIELMWNEEEEFFYDFEFATEKQSDFLSLAGFTPLWAGLATAEQAKKMVKKLPIFEGKYGLFITDEESLAKPINFSKIQKKYRAAIRQIIQPKQWDYPHIWPPLEYLTVVGLLRYGYVDEAKRIMEKSLRAHAGIFRKYGTFFEKIDGITQDKPKDFHYQTQSGFGWTNAIFYRYVKILKAIEKGVDIYGFTKQEEPPYDLAILY